jgi:DNA invertase Pin-like site-specific DNA recombinase
MCVLHHCDTPLCVRPDHLFLGTITDNNADMKRKGRNRTGGGRNPLRGMQHWRAKLTDADVLRMRLDPRSQNAIAKDYGIGQDQVSRIKNRLYWAHLP